MEDSLSNASAVPAEMGRVPNGKKDTEALAYANDERSSLDGSVDEEKSRDARHKSNGAIKSPHKHKHKHKHKHEKKGKHHKRSKEAKLREDTASKDALSPTNDESLNTPLEMAKSVDSKDFAVPETLDKRERLGSAKALKDEAQPVESESVATVLGHKKVDYKRTHDPSTHSKHSHRDRKESNRVHPLEASRHHHRRRSRSASPEVRRKHHRSEVSVDPSNEALKTNPNAVSSQMPQEVKVATGIEANGHGPTPKPAKQILSLEEMMEKKQEQNKPIKVLFLTKVERQKLQKQKALEEEELEKKKERDEIASRREFLMQEELEREKARRERQKERELERQRREEERISKDEEERNKLEDRRKKAKPDMANKSSLASLDLLNLPEHEMRARQQEKELEQIREHYLGMRKEKKKIQKPSEKFRNIFNFEWDASEDTARGDNNPLYQNRLEPQLLFGRGYRAGIDVREQRKHHDFYDQLVKQRIKKGEDIPAYVSHLKPVSAEVKVRDVEVEADDPSKKHWTEKSRESMTDRDWRIFREDFEIYIKGGRVPPPIRTWAESPLPWELLEAIRAVGYVRPTPIQMQAIPIALEQRDLIGIAETGSGKTAAFVLPMLTYVKGLPELTDETSQDGPYALILAPSRELALQIDEETKKFASFCKCRTVAVVGGRNAEDQAFLLRRGAEIVIGTPGRVKDCLERQYTVLNQCNYVVLDEADRMIDMGFEEIVNQILDVIPTTNLKSEDEALALQQEFQAKAGHRLYRLTHMFSATMPPAVERLSRKYLRAPAYISIGDPGAGKRSIEQRLEFMGEGKKKQRLQEVLEESEPPVIVFVNQKKVADVIAKSIGKMGYRAISLHGGKAQEIRESALTSFKAGEYDILVATDVAGRGIDIEGVQVVINFDMPKDIEAYTHRIGRTGRAGKKGLSISFVTEDNSEIFYDLKQLLLSTNNIVPMELSNHAASKNKPGAHAPLQAKKNQVLYKN